MVVTNRVSYLRSLLMYGAKMTACISTNQDTFVQKIKLTVDPAIRVEPAHQGCILALLDMIQSLAGHAHIADKGHKHSSGISEVVFYLPCPPTGQQQQQERSLDNTDFDPIPPTTPPPMAPSATTSDPPNQPQPDHSSPNGHPEDTAQQDIVARFDDQLREVLGDILDGFQQNLPSASVAFGVDASDPAVHSLLQQREPRRQIEAALRRLMENVVLSFPRIEEFVSYERFQPLLQETLDLRVPLVVDSMLAALLSHLDS